MAGSLPGESGRATVILWSSKWDLEKAARHSSEGRLLVVSHTDRGEFTRIMSARCATRKERKFYEEG